jgi:hypothetical protein
MIHHATRSDQESKLASDDNCVVTEPPSYGEESCAEPLVKYIRSAGLTPGHIDVTDAHVAYAAPKKFVFVSKKQMQWIDANRWYRQGARDAKIVPVEEITSERFSIDNRKSLSDVRPASDMSPACGIRNGRIRA